MTDVEFTSELKAELLRTNATDEDVALAAWVSTKGDDRSYDPGRVEGLINFLMRDQHMSPFEHGSFTFLVEAPIFVAREFMRHRTFSFNEWSGRYSELKPKFYLPDGNRNLIQVGKPGAYTFEPGSEFQHLTVNVKTKSAVHEAWDSYQYMLKEGIAKEVARMVLPVNIYTAFYATCNPRNLMHFLMLRTENEEATFVSHPQHEIAVIAEQMEEALALAMPLTHTAWVKNGRAA